MSHQGEPVNERPESGAPTGGRRRRAAEPVEPTRDRTWVIAAVVAVVCAGALALTWPNAWTTPTSAPETRPLTAAAALCPPAIAGGEDEAGAATLAGGSGEATLTSGGKGEKAGQEKPVELRKGEVTSLSGGDGALLVQARGELAAGLVAGRARMAPLAVTDCAAPSAEQWFVGVGAGPQHTSTVELVNPNPGSAVVDLQVFGKDGAADVPDLLGLAVPGESSRSIDLGDVVPREDDLAVRSTVVRGQVAVSVRDRIGQLAGDDPGQEWLPGQSEPRATSQLLGVPDGDDSVLTVANTGADQVSVTVKLVTPNAVVEPENAPELTVPPESVGRVEVGRALTGEAAKGVVGLQVEASGPVAASLRTLDGDDPALTAVSERVPDRSALVLPVGPRLDDKLLALGDADGTGKVDVVARSADGKELLSKQVPVAPGRGARLDLPDRAALVEIAPNGVAVAGAVVLSGEGAAVVPFRPLATEAEVPAVAPGLP